MRNLMLAACLIAARVAAAATSPYDAARSAIKNIGVTEGKELDVLIAQPASPALLADKRVAAFLNDNQAALESFRQAAEQSSDGYLFAPKAETLNSKTPIPLYSEYMKLIKLLVLDAEVQTARKQRSLVEKDMLAATGFLVQVSEQKSGAMIATLVQTLCLKAAYPVLLESIRGRSSSAYLKEISNRLAQVERNQDFAKAAFLEEAARNKGSFREGTAPGSLAEAREKYPFWKRLAARKLQDAEFFSILYKMVDAGIDDRTQALIEAFRANAPERISLFDKKREQEILSRKQARDKRSAWTDLTEGLKNGTEGTKRRMAEAVADMMFAIAPPQYDKILPIYHVFFCELNVLRAGLAVKLDQRAYGRLPADLNMLVPAFLSAVPQDSFNGFHPMRYVRTGNKFLVYSFGPDGKDNGGLTVLDWEAYSDDPTRSAGDIVYSD